MGGLQDMSWEQILVYVVCVSAHRAARTPWIPVNAFCLEHHFCFDAVTNGSVTQPLPSQLTVQSCLFWAVRHLALISCLFLKSETVHVYKNQIIERAVNIKNSNHVVCIPAKTRRSACKTD